MSRYGLCSANCAGGMRRLGLASIVRTTAMPDRFVWVSHGLCMHGCMSLFMCARAQVHQSGSGWSPIYADENLAVMSVGFLLPNPDDAVIWRGPKKNGINTFVATACLYGKCASCGGRGN
jgi:hypothetical protein